MPKPKECSHCQKQATIHLTQIVNNQVIKVDFCEDCVYKKQVLDHDGLSLSDLVAETLGVVKAAGSSTIAGLTCANCGLTQKDFQKFGRLGCAHCYGTFRTIITPILEEVQSGNAHAGKLPGQQKITPASKARTIRKASEPLAEDLEAQLNQAIADERYEEAAELRDRINALKLEKKNG